MRTIFLFAMLALGVRDGSAGAPPTIQVGATNLPAELKFTNRIETIQTTAGRGYTNVEVRSISPAGLIWWETGRVASGRIALSELDAEMRGRLGVPEEYLEFKRRADSDRDTAKINAALDRMEGEQRARQSAEERAATDAADEVVKKGQQTGAFGKISWSGDVVRVEVGPPFYLLTYSQKKGAMANALISVRKDNPKADFVRLMDLYSGNEVGTFGPQGLRMK